MHRLVEDQIKYDRYFIEEGQIAPEYIIKDERKILTKGMENSIDMIELEVDKSINLTKQITGKISDGL